MSLEIRHLSLAELLSHPTPFHMARYQRHYEWGRKEMDQLLGDLGDAFDTHRDDPSSGAFHFLGNVILFANQTGQLEVVDGQQRLTSLTLLLAAARNLCEPGPVQATLTNTLLIGASAGPKGEPSSRLHLHRGDNEFLREHILPATTAAALSAIGKQDRIGAECLRSNALTAQNWLALRQTAERSGFINFILASGRFVEIRVNNEDDAFRIFETVNNRGRPISSEDVLRYALVEFATDDMAKRDEFLARWDNMEAELGPRGMKRFIAGWRTRVAKGARPREPLHRTVLASFTTPEEARIFLDTELSADLSIFRQIENADVEISEGPQKARIDTILQSLELLDFDEWLPVATELIRRGSRLPERLALDLARVERLAWYYYLNRDDKGIYLDRRDRFAALMKIVSRAGTLDELLPRSLLSTEDRAKMRDIIQARLDPKWIPLRSLLVRFEMALASEELRIVRDDLTIEHVLPLRPQTKAWLSLYDNSQRVVTEHAELIGNLCLVSSELNTRLGNQIYANKRKLMLKHGLPAHSPLAADVARDTQWTREVIKRRSKWMLHVFCDTFQIHAFSR